MYHAIVPYLCAICQYYVIHSFALTSIYFFNIFPSYRERQFVLRQDETYFKDSWTACRSISCLGWASGNITDPLQLRLVGEFRCHAADHKSYDGFLIICGSFAASHLLGCVSWLLWSANGWGGFNGVSDLSSRSNAAAEGFCFFPGDLFLFIM